VLIVASLVVGACSDDAADRRTRTASPATAAPKPKAAYAGHGPYDAGVVDLALADGRRVVVWYPAAKAKNGQPREIFDIASLLTPELQSKVPADKRPLHPINAYQGAPAARGHRYPVVLFSHGYAGFPEQSANLTTHLARWGFIVVAPDHVERSLDGLLGTAARNVAKSTDSQVLSRSLDLALAEDGRAGSPLRGVVDTTKVSVIGHSAGAIAAYATASSDRRIKSFISYSIGFAGEKVPPVPSVPGMVMAGTTDGVIPIVDNERVFRGMKRPKYLVTIGRAGHLVFSDVCLIGRDQGGLVSLVRQVGLDIPEDLLRLAKDGCGPKDLDPVKAFPAIDHLSVAFLRSTLRIDRRPVGLDPGIAKAFPDAAITVTGRR